MGSAQSELHLKSVMLTVKASSTNSVDPDQTAPVGAILSWSTLFVSILA